MIVDRAKCRLDSAPAPFFIQSALDRTGDEGAPLAAPREAIEFAHQRVVQAYVQTHVCKLAHEDGCYFALAISAASVYSSGPLNEWANLPTGGDPGCEKRIDNLELVTLAADISLVDQPIARISRS